MCGIIDLWNRDYKSEMREEILSEKPFIKIVNDDCLNYMKQIPNPHFYLVSASYNLSSHHLLS